MLFKLKGNPPNATEFMTGFKLNFRIRFAPRKITTISSNLSQMSFMQLASAFTLFLFVTTKIVFHIIC